LRTIIVATLAISLLLPLCGLFFFRVYENQLIRQTEGELIAQSAVIAAVFRQEVLAAGIASELLGKAVKQPAALDRSSVLKKSVAQLNPIEPRLDLADYAILPRRPDAVAAAVPADPAFIALGQRMTPLLYETQDITLAGFRLLDPNGVVIAGGSEVGFRLDHVPEAAAALRGTVRTVLRARVLDEPPPPLYSISRGTKVRIFLAMPVIVNGQVAGVVYASRTPNNIVKHLYSERGKLVLAALTVLAGTILLGYVVSRTLTGPLLELTDRTRRIVAGDREAMRPLTHNGTREMAELSRGLLTMAQRLQDRSDQISTFATHVSHELKSPLTGIQGAAELIRDSSDKMDEQERTRFLDNIISDTGRLNLLVRRLMELAKAQSQSADGASSTVMDGLAAVRAHKDLALTVTGNTDLRLAIADYNLDAVLGNLGDNAAKHGATTLTIHVEEAEGRALVHVADDGSGISQNNAARIFDPFFTTRREDGGTGMGLGIVRAMLQAHNGTIELIPSDKGAAFLLTLPLG
ncbi:MAG: HAMP domain-containing sensor histidine kinase, partial [Rhizobiaceae bacterium]